ncbi:MAG: DNA cytosine methyltransferase, partial [Candidatus Paceibacterota bacterium]
MEIKNPFTVADFFAGIGLVTLGFHRSGWKVEYAVDYSSDKMEMYAQNFDGSHYELRDILEVAGEEVPDVTLAHASFPCTDVSVAGGRNGLNGEASSQIWSFIRILSEMNGRRPP